MMYHTTNRLSPEGLAEVGRALYGKYWRAPLAQAVGVKVRTVHSWEHGERQCPAWLPDRLWELLGDKPTECVELRRRLAG